MFGFVVCCMFSLCLLILVNCLCLRFVVGVVFVLCWPCALLFALLCSCVSFRFFLYAQVFGYVACFAGCVVGIGCAVLFI